MKEETGTPQKNIFSESTYRQILDAISDMIFVKGDRSNLLWANKAFCDFYGMSAEQLRGLIDAPINEDNTQSFLDDDRKVFQTGKILDIPKEPVVRHDGVIRRFHTVKSPIFDANKKVNLLVGLARDITDRLQAEEIERRNEKFLSSVLDNIPSVIYVKDLEGKYILVNDRYGKIFDLKKEQILGRTDHELFPAAVADAFRKNDLEIISSAKGIQYEETAPQTDGVHTFISSKFPLSDSEGKVYATCGISTDITERVAVEKMLQEERARGVFNAKLASLGEMAGGIAHEINTPLATLKTLSSQLIVTVSDEEVDRELVKEIAAIIEKTTDHMAGIIKNLRSFSRDGSHDPMTQIYVKKVMDDTLSFCRSKFINNQIEFSVSPVSETLSFYGREVEISQVIVNLLNNAFDAVESVAEKKVSVEVIENENSIEIAVSDSGTGISAATREKMFQPFHTTKEVGKGTGLGLSISRRIVESHGGSLTLDTNSRMTRFVVILPKGRISAKKS